MPYLLLVIGLLTGAYALYRFFIRAQPQQIKALFLAGMLLALMLALFYLAVTGRIVVALAILPALLPFFRVWLGHKAREKFHAHFNPENYRHKKLTEKDARDILGVDEQAGPQDIRAAYKRLMRKVHPDNEGSTWIAAKLNEARDLLLKQNN